MAYEVRQLEHVARHVFSWERAARCFDSPSTKIKKREIADTSLHRIMIDFATRSAQRINDNADAEGKPRAMSRCVRIGAQLISGLHGPSDIPRSSRQRNAVAFRYRNCCVKVLACVNPCHTDTTWPNIPHIPAEGLRRKSVVTRP